MHVHDHAQVLLGVDGGLHVEVEGRGTWIDVTCGMIVPAGAAHTYCATGTAHVMVLDDLTGPVTERLRRFALPQGWQQRWCDAKQDVGMLAIMLMDASTLHARRRIDLDALAERIDADLAHPWTVAELALACCLSAQRLRSRFSQALGQSPLAFVRARRLNRAERLLCQGYLLDAVSAQVGYASASALSFALRRERNSGARELRQRRAFLES